MKKKVRFIAALLSIMFLLSVGSVCSAALPNGYWPYLQSYAAAKEEGDISEILRTGDALLDFLSAYPIDNDIAGLSYNVYYDRYIRHIYEESGDYAAALENLTKLRAMAERLGFADMVTTVDSRIAKLDPMTEVYALTGNTAQYPYYGAPGEPRTGTVYGRVINIDGTQINNGIALDGETIVSFYVEVEKESAADYAWLIDRFDDGRHMIHIGFNFNETDPASTANAVVSGALDARISATLSYAASLKSQVLLRIGGEMNLFETFDPGLYKNAYVHIAQMARREAPNVALVFSPNYASFWGGHMADYYPGDEYVDWVGMSLYMNTQAQSGDEAQDAFFGRGRFCDCVLSAKEVVETFGGKKPIIVTECGAAYGNRNSAVSPARSAEQVSKLYSVLNMVYPQIKAIIYFDTDSGVCQYTLAGNSTVQSAYSRAISRNVSLARSLSGSEKVYTKLTALTGPVEKLELAAYSCTVYGSGMTVRYYLDGAEMTADGTPPYYCTISADRLSFGGHTLKVVFSDGAGYRAERDYTLTRLLDGKLTLGGTAEEQPAAWAAEEIAAAVGLGLLPEKFRSSYETNITRADFCELVVTLIEARTGRKIDALLQERGLSAAGRPFSDTSSASVSAAYVLGIVNGRGNGIFDPAAEISRQEAAKMLAVTAGVLGMNSPNGTSMTFADSGEFAQWAGEYIDFISGVRDNQSGKAVMGGVGDNRFSCTGKYTRQQAYVTMLRLFRAF